MKEIFKNNNSTSTFAFIKMIAMTGLLLISSLLSFGQDTARQARELSNHLNKNTCQFETNPQRSSQVPLSAKVIAKYDEKDAEEKEVKDEFNESFSPQKISISVLERAILNKESTLCFHFTCALNNRSSHPLYMLYQAWKSFLS
jgi:uncharacterized protein YaaN involved in tellurite resistance